MRKGSAQKAKETSKELRIKFDLEEFLTPYQAIQEVCHRYNIPVKELESLFTWVSRSNDIYLVSKKLNTSYPLYQILNREVPNLIYNSCTSGIFTLHFFYISEPIVKGYVTEPFDREETRERNLNQFYEIALAKEQNF